jgi:hypothetical protein
MTIGLDLSHAQDDIIKLEAKLYDEYEVKLAQQRNFMIAKVHDYLEHELNKLFNSFPERQAEIAAWKAANPALEAVNAACEGGDDEGYIADLEAEIEYLNAELSELLCQIELCGDKMTPLQNRALNEVKIT